MSDISNRLPRQPLMAVTLVIATSLLFVLGLPLLLEDSSYLYTPAKILTRLTACGFFMLLITRMGWASASGLSVVRPTRRWIVAMLPLMLIVGINLIGANWADIVFSPVATLNWLSYNLSVGLFEETMLRGLCFCVLALAWRNQKNGLMKAAFAQAIIFGLLHLINLTHAPVIDTVSQTLYATLLGIGFAGMVAYTGSIWPGVIMHVLINLAGSMNLDLVPGAVDTPGDVGGYLFAFGVIFLVSTLPGLVQLRHAARQQPPQTA